MRDAVEVSSAPSVPRHTVEIAAEPVAGPWMLEIGGVSSTTHRIIHPGQRLRIGSARSADLSLEDTTVSARHALLEATKQGVEVIDVGSTNGLFVGGARVARATLPGAGATFVVGRTAIVVRPIEREDDTTVGARRPEPLPLLVGGSNVMLRVARQVRRIAGLSRPVLIEGESGTGKDLVARSIHELSRCRQPFVPLNVTTLTETLADAQLFGFEKGAFTGAVAAREGAFQRADRGTLFLDEIADLGMPLQAKLLRVIEDGDVHPIGADSSVKVDIRLVCASWANLDERAADGRFREDLFHRIATFVIRMPPLRERPGDLPALTRHLLSRMKSEVGDKELTPDALAGLVAARWPGNVRQLSSVLYRAAVGSGDSRMICSRDLGLCPVGVVRSRAPLLDRNRARDLLRLHDGNVSAAARAAGVARSTYRAWLRRGSSGADQNADQN